MKTYSAVVLCFLLGMLTLTLVWAEPPDQKVEDAFYIRSQIYAENPLRPPVEFTHKKHVENYASDCTECHHDYTEGEPFRKCGECHEAENTDEALSLKNALHQSCRDCHINAGGEEGPAPTKCAECHGQIDYYEFEPKRTKPSVVFTHLNHWQKYNTPCATCHHKYENGENVWTEGDTVEKCVTCHKIETQGKAVKLRTAFHRQCKNCHKGLVDQGIKAPYRCNECHYDYKDDPYRAFPSLNPEETKKEAEAAS